MIVSTLDPFVGFKAQQRIIWANFAANEAFTIPPAARLVLFAGVTALDTVLDIGCGTGVVAITAARAGARVQGLDLTPELLERAAENAEIAQVHIPFALGDAEALPYADCSFDVVLSQFGHIFAPRPAVATKEMLRVLKPGGRLAFSSWPPEHGMGRLFLLLARWQSETDSQQSAPAAPTEWGDRSLVTERLQEVCQQIRFETGIARSPVLSAEHALRTLENGFGPLVKLLENLQHEPAQVARVRAEIRAILSDVFVANELQQTYLMTAAIKTA